MNLLHLLSAAKGALEGEDEKAPAGAGAFWRGVSRAALGHAAAEGHTGHAEGEQRQGRRLRDFLGFQHGGTIRHQGINLILGQRAIVSSRVDDVPSIVVIQPHVQASLVTAFVERGILRPIHVNRHIDAATIPRGVVDGDDVSTVVSAGRVAEGLQLPA